MSGSLSQNTRTAALLGGIAVQPVNTNNPTQYADRQRQFFDPETRAFTKLTARYASDFVEARVQGLKDDFNAWGTYRLRLADVVRPSAAIQRHFDDYKQFLFESPLIEYVRPGTKIETMGSTWLVLNPQNVSGASGSGLCRRCNAVWNYLDYYGNVVSEPIIAENERANANDSDAQASMLISKGYFNIICQYNEATRQIDTNTRFILGTGAYRVTGYSDFETEFTGDYSTVRLLSFTARYEEPNKAIDDMENHVAGGKNFSWEISVSGPGSMAAGMTAQFIAASVRNGESVASSEEKPISYVWTSSDESVATVDENGLVTALAEGETTITAVLEQNPDYSMSAVLAVTEAADGVFFTGSVPEELSAYETVTLTAAYFEDGVETEEALTWEFTGAAPLSFAAEVAADGKSAEITGYGFSATPLTVKIGYGAYSAEEEIALEGI